MSEEKDENKDQEIKVYVNKDDSEEQRQQKIKDELYQSMKRNLQEKMSALGIDGNVNDMDTRAMNEMLKVIREREALNEKQVFSKIESVTPETEDTSANARLTEQQISGETPKRVESDEGYDSIEEMIVHYQNMEKNGNPAEQAEAKEIMRQLEFKLLNQPHSKPLQLELDAKKVEHENLRQEEIKKFNQKKQKVKS